MQINTSYEVKEESSTQTSTEREIENINVSRTLSFVFRQMTQEFISLLHLVDVRIGATRCYGEPAEVASLSELDSLLARYLKEENVAAIRGRVLSMLQGIRDLDGKVVKDFIRPIDEKAKEPRTWIVNRKLVITSYSIHYTKLYDTSRHVVGATPSAMLPPGTEASSGQKSAPSEPTISR